MAIVTTGVPRDFLSTTVLVGAAVSLTNGTPANICQITNVPAGDWLVFGNVCFDPAASTTWTAALAWISTTSAATPTAPNNGGYSQFNIPATTGSDMFLAVGTQRLTLAAPTTVFLSVLAGFAVSTMVGYGFIGANRIP